MSDTDHDNLLFNMLKECKTLPTFLDHIFGFLQRRTDFYCVATDPNSPLGLPKGLAENLLRNAYYKWMPKNKDESVVLQEYEIPAVVEEEVETIKNVTEEINNDIDKLHMEHSYSHPKEPQQASTTESDFTQSESYNGAINNNYCWSQTINDIDITLKLPEDVSAKDLKVTILTHKISVKNKGEVLLEGDLCQKCKHNEAIWSLDKKKLQIHLDKCKEIWWDCLVTSEEKLDLSKIDCSRPFEELPEDAQAKIEELSWNQERKRLGMMTSDQLANQELLRKAWNAEGSPFSGEFDPSQVTFS